MSRRAWIAVLACAWCLGVITPMIGAEEFSLSAFLESELKAGKTRIVVPPGRYRVTPKHGVHLHFKDLTRLEIVAEKVEMVCTQTVQAVRFENCRDVQLRGLTVDYDPLPMTQGRITALAPDKSWIAFDVLPGYPENSLANRVEIFDPATGELRRTDVGWAEPIQSQGNHRYRVAKSSWYRYRPEWDTEQVGDILVTINQFPDRAGGHAFEANRCKGLALEDITLYAAPSMGFVEHQCDGSTYRRCKIDRRRPEEDPVHRSHPRMRSLNVDAFHSVAATKGPAILQCTAKFQGDDCINIHGTYHLITACEGTKLRIALAGRRLAIEPGDPVEFLPFEGACPTGAVAKNVAPDTPMTEAEVAFFKKVNLYPPSKKYLVEGSSAMYRVELDREIKLPMGSVVCASNRVGNGFVIQGCDFGCNRSRGILLKASRGEVSGNTLTRNWSAAILVAPEYWWLESASSCDLVIRDNRILGCRKPAIDVIALGGNGKPLPSGVHRNITITGNTISQSVWPNIHVTSTDGLVVKNNQLTPQDPENTMPPRTYRFDNGKTKPQPIVTEACEHAELQTP